MKIILSVAAIIVVLVALCGIVYLGYKTVDYMVNQHFSLGDAISWAWDDMMDLKMFEKQEDPIFIGYDTRNRIQLHGAIEW